MRREISIFNGSSDSMEVGVEPEGDAVKLQPGDSCVIRALSSDGEDVPDFVIEYEIGLLSVHLQWDKEVLVNGQKVQ